MQKLLVATGNAHKLMEIRAIFAEWGVAGWQIVGLDSYPDYTAPPEDAATFAENAAIKAGSAARMSGLLSLGDDSGLTVDALGGAPGVLSARYAADIGKDHDDAANRAKLLQEMSAIPDGKRQAAFVCAAALVSPGGETKTAYGECRGTIAFSERGDNGFGYDSLLYLPQLEKTMAELTDAEKNAISHRGIAMRKIALLLKQA